VPVVTGVSGDKEGRERVALHAQLDVCTEHGLASESGADYLARQGSGQQNELLIRPRST
jgi:hypothetical protein